jgi:hypothetical protein
MAEAPSINLKLSASRLACKIASLEEECRSALQAKEEALIEVEKATTVGV